MGGVLLLPEIVILRCEIFIGNHYFLLYSSAVNAN